MTTLEVAQAYLAAGLSVIPIRADGSKKTSLTTWKEYQQRLAMPDEVRNWWGKPGLGIAIVCGRISKGLEVLDFETQQIFAGWARLMVPRWLPSLDRLPQIQTPSGGMHVYYRTAIIAGNTKLARDERGETLIETRGEGGYVVAPGSPPECHPDKKEYRRVAGPSLLEIPWIEDLPQ